MCLMTDEIGNLNVKVAGAHYANPKKYEVSETFLQLEVAPSRRTSFTNIGVGPHPQWRDSISFLVTEKVLHLKLLLYLIEPDSDEHQKIAMCNLQLNTEEISKEQPLLIEMKRKGNVVATVQLSVKFIPKFDS